MSTLAQLIQFPKGRKEVIKFLTENAVDNFQKNTTPYTITRKMIDKVEDLKDKSILVMFNLEFLESLIYIYGVDAKNITFLADTQLENDFADKVYKVNTLLLTKENHSVKGIGAIMAKKTFDLIISNPPYNASIDIKILQEVTPLAKELVIVHPSTWCIDLKGKSKLFNDFRTQINGKVKYVELFNGNPIFNIGLFVPTMITHIKNNHKGMCDVKFFEEEFKVKSIFDVTKFGAEWFTIVKPFMDKFVGCDSVWDHKVEVREEAEGKFYCQLAGIIGNHCMTDNTSMVKDDFYTMVMKDSDRNKGIRNPTVRKDGLLVWDFTTELERNNFISYLKTDFARFCLVIYKNSQNNHYGEMSTIPYLDFTQEWNDEKLFEHFGIDDATQNYIREFLPDYYGIRK